MLMDKESKFGTLVLIKKGFIFNKLLSGISLQIGGSVCVFSTSKNSIGTIEQL